MILGKYGERIEDIFWRFLLRLNVKHNRRVLIVKYLFNMNNDVVDAFNHALS